MTSTTTHTPSGELAAGPLDPDLVAIERAMIRIRRRQTRQMLGTLANEGTSAPVQLEHVSVLDAIEEGRELRDEKVTVGDIAERLGIDPSRASRVVTAAINAGYVRRVAVQSDGRRIGLELTEAGEGIIEHAHRSRLSLYDRLLRDWSRDDRTEFARLLARFTEALNQEQAQSN